MLILAVMGSGLVFADSGIIINSALDKSTANVGDTVTLNVNVTNNGSLNYTNVQIFSPLPSGLQYVSSTTTGNYTEGVWYLGNLKKGVSKQLYVTFKVLDNASAQILDLTSSLLFTDQNVTTNESKTSLTVLNASNTTVNGTGNETGNNTTSNNTTTNNTNGTNALGLVLNTSINSSVAQVGDLVNFTITINNTGTKNFTNLQLYAPLPSGLEYVSSATNISNNNYTNGVWSLGNLKSGNCKQMNITARVKLDLIGQNTSLPLSLLPNSQNATPNSSSVNLTVSNHVNNLVNGNITVTPSVPVDSQWTSEILDNGSSQSKVVLDSNGYQHIVYFQLPILKYVYKTANGWVNETIVTNSTSRGTGFYPSLALDSSNNPQVVYNDGNTYLNYAYKDQSGWHVQTLLTADTSYTNIIMYNDSPRISFFDNGQETVKYAYKNGTNWVIESVDASSGHYNSLALDSLGNPRIAYLDANSGYLKYAIRTGPNAWKTVVVDNSSYCGSWNSLKIDSTGNPHISYVLANGTLKYASWDGINWITEALDNIKTSGTNLFLDESGNPKIAYFAKVNDTLNALKFIYKDTNSSNWFVEELNVTNGGSPWVSMALDSLGVPQICYSDNSDKLNLVYLIPIPAKVISTPDSGAYNKPFNVSLTLDKNTTIYYTTDGSDPRNSTNSTIYMGKIPISGEGSHSLKFAAVGNYSYWTNVWSDVYTKNYSIDTVAPSVSANVASGKYNTYKTITLSTNDHSSTIYYTTDGSDPRTSSKHVKYTSPISITKEGTTNLKFAAVDNATNWSGLVSKFYTLSFPSASITVSNKGTGKITVLYYLTVTLPNGKHSYKKFGAKLYPNKSYLVKLGKYPVGTKFTWSQFNYNSASYRKTINVYNKFLNSMGNYYTQRIHMTKVKRSHYVYSVEKTEITSVGIKATVIKAPIRK